MSTIDTYGSIDNLVNCYIERLANHITKTKLNVYEYLVSYESKLILLILGSNTNEPSVHDLYLLNHCIIIRNKIYVYKIGNEALIKEYDDILEIYKNRKV